MREIVIDKFKDTIYNYGYKMTEQQFDKFVQYYDLLLSWNDKINLTAITDFGEVLTKHFVDSLSICKIIDLGKCQSLIDIGTGAGFPGIPIKIMYPKLDVVLLDSLQKRIGFLDTVIAELSLEGITTIHARAEELAKDSAYREQFDVCVSRAVANLSSLTELCLPFVKVGGSFISYKSEKAQDELDQAQNAITILGGSFEKKVVFDIDSNVRTLIQIGKIENTAGKYPRKPGTPIKKPL